MKLPVCRSAILLAAGLGTRLRPLTNNVPKPLLPIGTQRLIDFPLRQLAKAQVHEVVINLHYHGTHIRHYVGDGTRYGLRVSYSDEPVILGTGGGIQQAATYLTHRTAFYVLNGDVWSDLDLQALWRTHTQARNAAATLAIRRLPTSAPYTPLQIGARGQLTAIGQGDVHYVGVMIGTGQLLATLPPAGRVAGLVRDGLEPLLKTGAYLQTYQHEGAWSDVGTPQDLAWVRVQHENPPCLSPENSS